MLNLKLGYIVLIYEDLEGGPSFMYSLMFSRPGFFFILFVYYYQFFIFKHLIILHSLYFFPFSLLFIFIADHSLFCKTYRHPSLSDGMLFIVLTLSLHGLRAVLEAQFKRRHGSLMRPDEDNEINDINYLTYKILVFCVDRSR